VDKLLLQVYHLIPHKFALRKTIELQIYDWAAAYRSLSLTQLTEWSLEILIEALKSLEHSWVKLKVGEIEQSNLKEIDDAQTRTSAFEFYTKAWPSLWSSLAYWTLQTKKFYLKNLTTFTSLPGLHEEKDTRECMIRWEFTDCNTMTQIIDGRTATEFINSELLNSQTPYSTVKFLTNLWKYN